MNDTQIAHWRFGTSTWLVLSISVVAAISAYYGGIVNLIERWNAEEEYNHGYFLPLVTLVFLWSLKPTLARLNVKPSWWGPGLAVLALLMLIVGELSALYLLIHYSFIVLLLALSLATLGWSGTRHTWIPIGLLVFAIPIPYFLEATITSKLQLISSKFGVFLIRLWNIPVFREGNLIDLGSFKLEVIEACSGLTYLYPLLGFGCICAYLYRASWWKRAFVIVSTIPIAILLNSFRIGMIGILVKYFGSEQARGFLHDFEGFAVFMVCVAILFAEMWALTFVGPDKGSFNEVFGLTFHYLGDRDQRQVPARPLAKPLIACAVIVACFAVLVQFINERVEIKPIRKPFSQFPLALADWRGKTDILEPEVLKTLALTDYLLVDFQDATEQPVNFYAAYYDSQRKGTSPHSPAVCLPGGGWQIIDFRRQRFPHGVQGPDAELNRVIISKGKIKQLVYYWFEERGRVIADEYLVKWYLFRDALLDNRTDGALVRITTPLMNGEAEAAADDRIHRFLAHVLPILPDYIPK